MINHAWWIQTRFPIDDTYQRTNADFETTLTKHISPITLLIHSIVYRSPQLNCSDVNTRVGLSFFSIDLILLKINSERDFGRIIH